MKAQLFILAGRDVGRSFDIEETAVLGRAPGCEVRLRDRSISRKHAVVRFTGEGWVVEDLGSRNGIKFRDERVPEAELKNHDEFVLGELPIRFRLPEQAEGQPVRAEGPSAAVDEIELEDEIVLVEDAELESEAPTVATRREPVRLAPAPADPPRTEGARPEPDRSEYERRRAQILAATPRTSFLRGDLSQRPFWLKCLVGILLTGMALGLSFLAFRVMQTLRGSS